MKKPYRPYDDGIRDRAFRKRERMKVYSEAGRKPRLRATEILCSECHTWFKVSEPDTWCVHLAGEPAEVESPSVHVFKPFYHPNIQPGGAWIDSARKYKEAQRICGKEPTHG